MLKAVSPRVLWLSGLAVVVAVVIAVVVTAQEDSETTNTASQSGQPGGEEAPDELLDGRGYALREEGIGAGEAWYCEDGGSVADFSYGQPIAPEEGEAPDESSPGDVLARALRETVLDPETAVAVTELSVDGVTQESADAESLSREEAVAAYGEESDVRLTMVIYDDNRTQLRAAGFMEVELIPDIGWVPDRMRLCSSAATGVVELIDLEEVGG